MRRVRDRGVAEGSTRDVSSGRHPVFFNLPVRLFNLFTLFLPLRFHPLGHRSRDGYEHLIVEITAAQQHVAPYEPFQPNASTQLHDLVPRAPFKQRTRSADEFVDALSLLVGTTGRRLHQRAFAATSGLLAAPDVSSRGGVPRPRVEARVVRVRSSCPPRHSCAHRTVTHRLRRGTFEARTHRLVVVRMKCPLVLKCLRREPISVHSVHSVHSVVVVVIRRPRGFRRREFGIGEGGPEAFRGVRGPLAGQRQRAQR